MLALPAPKSANFFTDRGNSSAVVRNRFCPIGKISDAVIILPSAPTPATNRAFLFRAGVRRTAGVTIVSVSVIASRRAGAVRRSATSRFRGPRSARAHVGASSQSRVHVNAGLLGYALPSWMVTTNRSNSSM